LVAHGRDESSLVISHLIPDQRLAFNGLITKLVMMPLMNQQKDVCRY